MKKKLTPYMFMGLAVLAVYFIVDRFVMTIDVLVAVPILLVVMVLLVTDGLKRKSE
jgi:hypothetical protein